jgi:DNA-binding response OmpR family regulator
VPRAERILIAEDDEHIRALLETVLGRAGFVTEACVDGREALAAASRDPARLYLIDVRMPDLSGLQVCRELKGAAHTRGGPILLMSAECSTEQIAAGLAAGADDFLAKPFRSAELLTKIGRLLAA